MGESGDPRWIPDTLPLSYLVVGLLSFRPQFAFQVFSRVMFLDRQALRAPSYLTLRETQEQRT